MFADGTESVYVSHESLSTSAIMQNIPEKRRETDSLRGPASRDGEGRGDSEEDAQGKQVDAERETLMMELTRLVQKSVRESSWWEKRGIDCTILTAAFISLPAGNAKLDNRHNKPV